jgi:hypothetical protein
LKISPSGNALSSKDTPACDEGGLGSVDALRGKGEENTARLVDRHAHGPLSLVRIRPGE